MLPKLSQLRMRGQCAGSLMQACPKLSLACSYSLFYILLSTELGSASKACRGMLPERPGAVWPYTVYMNCLLSAMRRPAISAASAMAAVCCFTSTCHSYSAAALTCINLQL